MSKAAYTVALPDARTTSVVFASPHSGRDYAWSFLRRTVLDERAIRSSEDAFVDLLLESATEFGAPLLKCTAPRAFIDVNRSLDELDPALIDGVGRSAQIGRAHV
jgi:N-formylglutamate amidohydrolase